MLEFGGLGRSNACAQTWSFVGGVWTQLHPSDSPSARLYVQMVYDSVDHCVVLYAGQNYAGTNLGTPGSTSRVS